MKRPLEDINEGEDVKPVIAEESDDIVPPHDVSKEGTPSSPYFSEQYRNLMDGTDAIVGMLEEPLKNSKYQDATVAGLLAEIKQRTTSNFPEEVRIALVGDMKSGKSSVINSILSLGMVARQGDAGSSCTWVVQEFGYLFPGQEKPFAAKVFFFSQEEQHEIIRNLVSDYCRACNGDEEATEGSKSTDQSIEDFAVKRTVITAFRALFIKHNEFNTTSAANGFLSAATSGDDEHIVDTLCEWADELMSETLGEEAFISEDAATTQTLLWHLAPFMTTVEERDDEPNPSLWPLVSHIKFGLDVALLKHNITLVDLPGLSDANKTRVANAMKHLQLCTHYMVVAEIGRADDDKFIRDALKRGQVTRGDARTILVLTHSDSIDDETDVTGTTKDFQFLRDLEDEIQRLEHSKDKAVSQVRFARGAAKYPFMAERDMLVADINARTREHRQRRIHMRSHVVCLQMQELYAELTNDPNKLPVFCVGNAAYKKYQAGFSIDDPNQPALTVQGTNIPALRKHLLLAPAEAKLNEARHMVATQLPILLSCFSMYVSKTHLDRKDEVESMIIEPQNRIPSIVAKIFKGFSEQIEGEVLDKIRGEEFDWSGEAQELLQGWAKSYSTPQHLALLKRYGHKKGRGKNAADTSWTGELISLRSSEVRSFFDDFMRNVNEAPKNITKQLYRLLGETMLKIKSDPQVKLMALQPYLEYLFQERGNIGNFVDRSVRVLRRDLGNVVGAVTGDNADNHIVIAMQPIYDHAQSIKGRVGTPKDRARVFETDVIKIDNGVWMKAHRLVKQQLEEILRKHEAALLGAADTFFKGLQDKFHVMCSAKEVDDPDEIELREKLQKMLVLANEKLATEVKPAADALFDAK
ncbi:hypothetical protein CB0940_03403 [Cercospora beticola]|uniref:Uncharacterized protein n=1 Tax=Cercospora beticola TaxID=122368 RepID=A0A2G5I2E0_CERBT|nr:hypothetical protein CB0940_03403 [Cercospora beticola]PIA98930.1 hypothetical protein CB0940_03403 [Cercospora beticola]WPB00578.1 hypothetical protein RHO25_005198 [Cercospora beticola]CAK1361203.1 unnamed protein product [Cercospora beticola]